MSVLFSTKTAKSCEKLSKEEEGFDPAIAVGVAVGAAALIAAIAITIGIAKKRAKRSKGLVPTANTLN